MLYTHLAGGSAAQADLIYTLIRRLSKQTASVRERDGLAATPHELLNFGRFSYMAMRNIVPIKLIACCALPIGFAGHPRVHIRRGCGGQRRLLADVRLWGGWVDAQLACLPHSSAAVAK